MNKTCTKCHTERPIDSFRLNKRTGKHENPCKICSNARQQQKRQDPAYKAKEKAQRDEYRARPEIQLSRKQCAEAYRNTPERKQAMQEYHMVYYEANKEHILEKNRRNELIRLENDPNFVERKRLRGLLNLVLKRGVSKSLIEPYLGCSTAKLRDWMQFQFTAEMNWDNYGDYWHVDHVQPCANYDLTDEEQRKRCFHWTNLRPSLPLENMRKSKKADDELIEEINEKLRQFNLEAR